MKLCCVLEKDDAGGRGGDEVNKGFERVREGREGRGLQEGKGHHG